MGNVPQAVWGRNIHPTKITCFNPWIKMGILNIPLNTKDVWCTEKHYERSQGMVVSSCISGSASINRNLKESAHTRFDADILLKLLWFRELLPLWMYMKSTTEYPGDCTLPSEQTLSPLSDFNVTYLLWTISASDANISWHIEGIFSPTSIVILLLLPYNIKWARLSVTFHPPSLLAIPFYS